MGILEEIRKHREVFLYLIFGILTTICNYVVFYLCFDCFMIHYIVSNIFAWFLSVLFAYYTNRRFVFFSNKKGSAVLSEISSFFISRAFSGILETLMLWICVDCMGFGANIVKIVVSIVVVILNYIFSKFIVFRKR